MDWWTVVAALALHLGPDDAWARVLTGLDHQRSQAYAAGDPAPLGGVYVAGAERADAASIADYRARGGRVRGTMLLESVQVVRASNSQVVLDVVDRLGPARVDWTDGTSTRLPRDRATRREVVLVSTPDGWRVAGSRVTPP